MTSNDRYRILVKEKIAESGVGLLRERFDVDLGLEWSDEELLTLAGIRGRDFEVVRHGEIKSQ